MGIFCTPIDTLTGTCFHPPYLVLRSSTIYRFEYRLPHMYSCLFFFSLNSHFQFPFQTLSCVSQIFSRTTCWIWRFSLTASLLMKWMMLSLSWLLFHMTRHKILGFLRWLNYPPFKPFLDFQLIILMFELGRHFMLGIICCKTAKVYLKRITSIAVIS